MRISVLPILMSAAFLCGCIPQVVYYVQNNTSQDISVSYSPKTDCETGTAATDNSPVVLAPGKRLMLCNPNLPRTPNVISEVNTAAIRTKFTRFDVYGGNNTLIKTAAGIQDSDITTERSGTLIRIIITITE